jgi:O-antigen polymerase
MFTRKKRMDATPYEDARLVKYLLVFCLLLGIHINIPNTGGTGLEMPYNAITWGIISLIMSAALFHLSKQQRWFSDPTLKLVGLIMLSITLPVFFQEITETSLAGTRILGILAGLTLTVLFFQSFQSQQSWQQMLFLLVVAGLIEGLICLTQQYLPEIAKLGVYKTDYGRPFGSFQQPNVSASFIATTLVCSLYLLINPGNGLNTPTHKAVLVACAIISGMSLPLLGSRAGIYGAALGVAFLLPQLLFIVKDTIRQNNQQPFSSRWVGLWFISLAGGVLIALFSIQSMETGGRNLESFTSTANRSGIYLQSLDMIMEKPLSGWGYGNFERNFLEYYAQQYQAGKYQHTLIENLDHPHNELLLWAVEGGVIPPLLLIILAIILLIRAIKRLGTAPGLAALGVLVPMAFHANTEYPFYQSSAHWLIFCLLTAWLLWKTGKPNVVLSNTVTSKSGTYQSELPPSSPFRFRFFAQSFGVLIPLITIPLMLLCVQATHKVTQYHASKRQNFEYLTEVIHPSGIWKRFFFDVMTYRLNQGVQNQNQKHIQAYITWAEEFLTHTPRLSIYSNLASAYWALGNKEQAISTIEQAAYLYPHRQTVKDTLQRLRKLQENNPQT